MITTGHLKPLGDVGVGPILLLGRRFIARRLVAQKLQGVLFEVLAWKNVLGSLV